MDPYLEQNPLFHELHTQFLAEAQRLLQPQLRPRYVAKLERHLSEGSVWGLANGTISLDRKEPDLTLTAALGAALVESTALLAKPLASAVAELDADELALRQQRRLVIYVNAKPRQAVTGIELLSPTNKEAGSVGQARYLEKRSSALHGGLHWVEIDLLRGGERPPLEVKLPRAVTYLAYVAQAQPTGWNYLAYGWQLHDPLPKLPIPLLGGDQAVLDLGACLRAAYDSVAADEEVDYAGAPPPPALRRQERAWVRQVLRERGAS